MEWFWYLLAFVTGSAVTWLATVLLVRHTGDDEIGGHR